MSEEIKFRLLVGGFVIWVLCAVAALSLNIGWLGGVCAIVAVIAMAANNAQRDIEITRHYYDMGRANGPDWAVRKLPADSRLSNAAKEGLKRAIREA